MIARYANERGRVARITPYQDRKAREILYTLLRVDLLVSDSERGKVRLDFPVNVVESWFPRLYPEL